MKRLTKNHQTDHWMQLEGHTEDFRKGQKIRVDRTINKKLAFGESSDIEKINTSMVHLFMLKCLC